MPPALQSHGVRDIKIKQLNSINNTLLTLIHYFVDELIKAFPQLPVLAKLLLYSIYKSTCVSSACLGHEKDSI